ncbi:MAG: ABC transporter ATP-binding protein, partial [Dehalococcoidia bacterium]
MKLGSERLSAGYPAAAELVIEGLDIKVDEGEIVSLVGPNGSGKSTLLRALARVLKPKSGVVVLDGKSIAEWPTREVAKRLALLPQGPVLNAAMTVEELVWMGRSPHQGILGLPTAADRQAVELAIEETGIAPLAKRQVALLSGGERQRAWLAMAIAQQPRVLLLDEPTTFLDLNHQLEVLDLIRQLNRQHGLTVVMVLHDLNQAARYSSRICVLKDGRIYGEGAPEAILTPATLREVFQIEAQI